jgi:hypothetical protein
MPSCTSWLVKRSIMARPRPERCHAGDTATSLQHTPRHTDQHQTDSQKHQEQSAGSMTYACGPYRATPDALAQRICCCCHVAVGSEGHPYHIVALNAPSLVARAKPSSWPRRDTRDCFKDLIQIILQDTVEHSTAQHTKRGSATAQQVDGAQSPQWRYAHAQLWHTTTALHCDHLSLCCVPWCESHCRVFNCGSI